MTFGDRVRAFFGVELATKASKTRAPYATSHATNGSGSKWGVLDARRGARSLRRFAETDVWVRTAINRRKREIGKAKWSICRIDDPRKSPDPKLVKQVTELFRFVNPKRESLRALLDMIVEDILVLDAGCIEKEKTLGGEIVALWAVDGATIKPAAKWDGSNPRLPRYQQIVDGVVLAELLNDELVYIMANPRTSSNVGLSPLETLFQTVEAELYGEHFEYALMKETAPAGMIRLGGVDPATVQQFREYWESEIAGTRDIVIVGGGDSESSGPDYVPFARSAKDEMRREYMKWLATKVASAFEMDLMAFNLTENIHRSVGQNAQQKTDDGLMGLATLISEYVTREIIWEIDPNHEHGFQFDDLTVRDAMAQAQIDKIAMSIGVTTPNEIRAREGLDPFPGSAADPEHWANLPYPFNDNTAADPEEDPLSTPPDDGSPGSDGEDKPDQGADYETPTEGAKSFVPFVRAVPPTLRQRSGYLSS